MAAARIPGRDGTTGDNAQGKFKTASARADKTIDRCAYADRYSVRRLDHSNVVSSPWGRSVNLTFDVANSQEICWRVIHRAVAVFSS